MMMAFYFPPFHVLPIKLSSFPERAFIARARFRSFASEDFKFAKYLRTSFLRLGARFPHAFFAFRFLFSADRNHAGIGCIGPFLYFSSNAISKLNPSPTFVFDALRISPCR